MSDEEIENFRIEINKVKEFKEKFYEMCEENVYSPNIIFAGLVSLSYGREKTQIFRSEMNRSSCF